MTYCADCGAEIQKRPEKALSGESQLVWTDIQSWTWTCDYNDGNEHRPSDERTVAWFAQVTTESGVTYWGPFTPHEASDFLDSTIGDDGVEDATVVSVNLVSPTSQWGDLDTTGETE